MKALPLLAFVAAFVFHSVLVAQISWQKQPESPVFPVSFGAPEIPNGFYYTFAPGIYLDPGEKIYRMWFTSLSLNGGTFCISSAISLNLKDWFVNAKNPVLKNGPGWDNGGVVYPCVIKDNTGYKMYYGGNWARLEIGVATSPDGVTWTKHPGNPIIHGGNSGQWNYALRDPAVIYEDGIYKVWFEGRNGYPSAIGYATSTDGFSWTMHPGNPIIIHGPSGSWEEQGVGEPTVVRVNGIYHMIYTGYTNQLLGRLGYASSLDGITWQKYANNPVLQLGKPGEWDQHHVASPALLYEGGKFHLWHNGTSNGRHQIGYAIAQAATTDQLFVQSNASEAESPFEVKPNYPNPFNSTTTLYYSLPEHGSVRVIMYDLLGQQVQTLALSQQNAGLQSVVWDGKDSQGSSVGSGTYLARIEFTNQAGVVHTRSTKVTVLR